MAYIYFAPWEWKNLGTYYGWVPPNEHLCTGSLDLRPNTKCAEAGGSNPGYGVFKYETEQDGIGELLTNNITDRISLGAGDFIKSELGLGEKLVANKTLDVIWEILNRFSDPTGQTAVKPLKPNHQGILELYFGDYGLVKSEPYQKNKHPAVVPLLKEDLKKTAEAVGRGEIDLQTLQKYLFALSAQTKEDPSNFLLPDMPQITPLRPTTFTMDNFNRPDTTVFDGNVSSAGWTWTEFAGTWWEIIDNQAGGDDALAADNGFARANFDLSSVDMYAQVVLTNQVTASSDLSRGVLFRKDSTSTVTFYGVEYADSTTSYWRTFKMVSGTFTGIGANTNGVTCVPGDVLRGDANGSTIRRLRNGSTSNGGNSTTDTSITSGLRAGLSGYRSGSVTTLITVDDFYMGDYFTVERAIPRFSPLRPRPFLPGNAR